MDDYYQILQVNNNSTKEEIKKQYHNLCKKYHPDKNEGDDTQFKKINEAYITLSDDQKRKEYNIRRTFKNIDFTPDELQVLFSYYDKFIESKEYKLMKLIYHSIPQQLKTAIWEKFKKFKLKQIFPANKIINIENLDEDFIIHLGILHIDKIKKRFKMIIIQTKYGMLPLNFRTYENIIIHNITCKLTIKFFIRDNYNAHKRIN